MPFRAAISDIPADGETRRQHLAPLALLAHHAVARDPAQGIDAMAVGMQKGADQHQVVLLIARLLL